MSVSFADPESDLSKDKLIEELKERVKILEEIIKSKNIISCVCVIENCVYGDELQLEEMFINCVYKLKLDEMSSNYNNFKFTKQTSTRFGKYYHFVSIASARTFLLINGFKFSYNSEICHYDNGIGKFLYKQNVENWIRETH